MSGQAASGQNPAMSAIVRKRLLAIPKSLQGKLKGHLAKLDGSGVPHLEANGFFDSPAPVKNAFEVGQCIAILIVTWLSLLLGTRLLWTI
jgi:hypothetical protein